MNTTAASLTFGDLPFEPNRWQTLDDLWIFLGSREREFIVSYTHGRLAQGRWLQFANLAETRFPIGGELTMSQRLATRPVVARPNHPLHLPGGERITLFVGTSLWLCLKRGDDTLLDIPVARLSDTWFGPNTRHGEVCFDCQTHARLSLERAAPNPFKAITPIRIKNETNKPLVIDRVNLPMPHLTLYRGPDRLWTSQLTITRRIPDVHSEVHVSSDAPKECGSAEKIAAPRVAMDGSILHKAMGLLLG